jgi:hypothetical protein
MNLNCENFLRNVLNKDLSNAASALRQMTWLEVLQCFSALDRLDLEDIYKQRNLVDPKDQIIKTKIEVGYKVVKDKKIPSPVPSGLKKAELNEIKSFLAKPSRLEFDKDLTGILPSQVGTPPSISESDYEAYAERLDVEVSAIMAVASVESGRLGGFYNGRPVIRYELHIFHKLTGGIYQKSHPHLSQPTFEAGNKYHVGGQKNEWSLLYGAMILRDQDGRRRYDEALSSASWGRFQIMGFNATKLGWSSVKAFVIDMFTSEVNHLEAFVRFCQNNNLIQYIKNKDWANFAYRYNGPKYKVNRYDKKMKEAYNRIRQERIKAGKKP